MTTARSTATQQTKLGGNWAARAQARATAAPGHGGIGFTAAERREEALEGDRAQLTERLGDGIVRLRDGLGEVEEGSRVEEGVGCHRERTTTKGIGSSTPGLLSVVYIF
jgi:hypothetical protein